MEKFKICLAANYPEHPQDCVEQCESCKEFQHHLENPKKMDPVELEKLMENYRQIIKKSKLFDRDV